MAAKLVMTIEIGDGESKSVGWELDGLSSIMIGITLKDLLGPAKEMS